ncbi:MAG: SDR family NAD(P)-dependent oxidoreductase, partial [Pseudomonadota bacterium]
MTGRLAGKTAFVTGGAGGIGQAICTRFAAEGAAVTAADPAPWPNAPEGISPIRYDVTDEAGVIAAFDRIAARQEALDILVNAAGIEIEKTIEETSLDDWDRIFAINVTGTFLTCRAALPL